MSAPSRLFLWVILQSLSSLALAQPAEKLGELTFPNSGQANVQEAFLR